MTQKSSHLDEWGVLVAKQAELNSLYEEQQKQKQRQQQRNYKLDLDYLQAIKDIQREQERILHEKEKLAIAQRAQIFKETEAREREEQRKAQINLREAYNVHKGMASEYKDQQRQQELEIDQAYISNAKHELEKEKQRFSDLRMKQQQDQTFMRQDYDRRLQDQKQKAQQDREYDQWLVQQAVQQVQQRDQRYREFYNKKSEAQQKKSELWLKQVNQAEQKRQQELSQWQLQQERQKALEDAQLENERMNKRLQQIHSTAATQKEQIAYKEAQSNSFRNQKALQDQTRQAQLQEQAKRERQELEQRRREQEAYKNSLQFQVHLANNIRLNQLRLSDHERKVNRRLFGEELGTLPGISTSVPFQALAQRGSVSSLASSGNNIIAPPSPKISLDSPKIHRSSSPNLYVHVSPEKISPIPRGPSPKLQVERDMPFAGKPARANDPTMPRQRLYDYLDRKGYRVI